MVIFTSKNNSEITVTFKGSISDKINIRGNGVTTSINEINKPYYIRLTNDITSASVTYMSSEQYLNLFDLIEDGNNFDVKTSEGEYFDNVYISDSPELSRKKSTNTKEYYRTGTLSLGCV